MKLVTHDNKMNKLRAPHDYIEVVIELPGLVDLVCVRYDTT